jgi:hypothetical protein
MFRILSLRTVMQHRSDQTPVRAAKNVWENLVSPNFVFSVSLADEAMFMKSDLHQGARSLLCGDNS